ncbi:FkbM family methyltransferase [Candidatus Pelagibacter sp.]|jgi:FkbM family methyltransferase|nr:FkbM family methyltransferase [Candidatus Pelagibacter sp.]MDA9956050.1 FkbM family methyltransferase [Candidatus Pelagibacter sp.]
MGKISESSIFYKPYLYYNLYVRFKALRKRNTYSQNQEDLFINDYFKEKNSGFYIDIGCYHPIKYSNTALLYNRGWKGINIDMNQTSIDLFNILRKRDKNICAAISNTNKKTIQYFDHLFSPINTLDKNFSSIASKKISFRKHTEKTIQTYRFNQIIQKYDINIKQIDFINIDVEAHDLEVLESIDLSIFNPKIICVEIANNQNNIKEKKLRNYLNKYNYELIKIVGLNGFFELRD